MGGVSKKENKRQRLKGSNRLLELKGCLCGHNRRVSCISISTLNGKIVSGSADCSVIVWDISDMVVVRMLFGHEDCILCVSINERSGNIVSHCAFIEGMGYKWPTTGKC